MRKATKIVISFAVVLIAGLNMIVPAFAQDPFTAIAVGGLTGASGAGLFGSMAGMSGINIGWGTGTSDDLDAMWNVLNPDHVYFSGEKHEADPQDPDDLYDYIKVDIGDWLQAQSDFIVNFAQTHQVDDNDSGTVQTVANIDGFPVNVEYEGQLPTVSGSTLVLGGDVCKAVLTRTSNTAISIRFYYNGNLIYTDSATNQTATRWRFKVKPGNLPRYDECIYRGNDSYTFVTASFTPSSVSPAINVPWSSEVVDLDVFDNWGSAKVKIPKSISQLQSGWTPVDFFNELDRIWYGAGQDNIIIEDGDNPGPVPPVPIPDTPLGEVPFDDWIDLWGQGIYQQLENQSDTLDLIGSNGIDAIEELESIDTNTEDLVEVAESIDTNIGVGNGILGGIRSLTQSAVNYLEGIAEHVGELVEEIVEGTETLIAGILNQIPQAFSVIFGPIKQASSIWHYVVEWITSIGAPFQFIWSMASGTSYYMILPVYASLAAAVVLAFFKRFGR